MTNVEELTREDAIYYARLSEQGERYQDMIMYMKKVAKVVMFDKLHCAGDKTMTMVNEMPIGLRRWRQRGCRYELFQFV